MDAECDHRSERLVSPGMNQPLRSRLKAAASAFASNAVNGNLRRAQLSFIRAWTAEWAFTVALGVVAYRDGGGAAAGLVGLLRMVPAAGRLGCCAGCHVPPRFARLVILSCRR